jgi:hypothetical protein
MSIGEQFKGLDMKNLIGGPLTAAAEANLLLARTTANFINEVGFDADRKARTVQFKYNKQEPMEDGSLVAQDMSVDVPLLAIVPIPNLQIDEVNVMFDMEVKQCEKSESAMSGSGSFSAKVGWGPISVSISGSVSAHSSNTRSSDQSAKYHVDVRATNHGTPEGLARVLDMMAASISPNLVGSRPTDPSGSELSGARRARALKLKELRERSMQLENAEKAAGDTRDMRLRAFAQRLQSLQNVSLSQFDQRGVNKGEGDDKDKEEEKADGLNESVVSNFWNDLQIGAGQKVSLAVSLSEENKALPALKTLCPPADGDYAKYTEVDGADNEFKSAVKAHKDWASAQKAVEENKTKYNSEMMGISSTEPAPAIEDKSGAGTTD